MEIQPNKNGSNPIKSHWIRNWIHWFRANNVDSPKFQTLNSSLYVEIHFIWINDNVAVKTTRKRNSNSNNNIERLFVSGKESESEKGFIRIKVPLEKKRFHNISLWTKREKERKKENALACFESGKLAVTVDSCVCLYIIVHDYVGKYEKLVIFGKLTSKVKQILRWRHFQPKCAYMPSHCGDFPFFRFRTPLKCSKPCRTKTFEAFPMTFTALSYGHCTCERGPLYEYANQNDGFRCMCCACVIYALVWCAYVCESALST